MRARRDAMNIYIKSDKVLIRLFDILLSFAGLIIFSPLLIMLLVLVRAETNKPIFLQIRVGKNQREFRLVKFRTMKIDTVNLPTHLVSNAAITKLGRFLRRTKLDELPQLWNVLRGDMSIVGPRPGLPSQRELTAARESAGVFAARPGITGLAQIRGIDMSTPKLLAKTDALMLRRLDIFAYLSLITKTALGSGAGDRLR